MPHASIASETRWRGRANPFRLALAIVLLAGVVARLSVFAWSDPWGPHHPDEHILPIEAVALWEGMTPREVGWPASTTRLALSATAAVQWLADTGSAAWHERSDPSRALVTVTDWIGRHYLDPSAFYMSGRIVSILIGLLQVIAAAWALSRWTGERGVLIGTLAAAISPVAVLHSQYVLADVTGVLFATVLVGLAARPTERQILGMGLLAGLAAASKFHFGLWLLTPLVCIWLRPAGFAHRLRLSMSVIGLAAWVILTLVPWFWVNPVLALKEFGAVVLVKVGAGAGAERIPVNLIAIFSGLGLMLWLAALAATFASGRSRLRELLPVAVPTLIGTVALAGSSTVSGRYGLVLMPGLLVLAATAWEKALSHPVPRVRIAVLAALGVCVLATAVSLFQAESVAGEVDVDVLARDWIVAHVPQGSRVAVYDEVNAYLPQAPAQLRACADEAATHAAYSEKWRLLGFPVENEGPEPFRSTLLNDEMFRAYICARELAVSRDAGYFVIPYHNEPRFGALLEREAFDTFKAASDRPGERIDVLVVNRTIDAGTPPAVMLRTRRGLRVIYTRSGGFR